MPNVMEWYEGVVHEESVNAVAEKAGLVQSTLNRQVRAKALSHEAVVAIARAYGEDVIDALIASGLITDEDVQKHGVFVALSAAHDLDIGREVMKRLASGDHPILEAPLA